MAGTNPIDPGHNETRTLLRVAGPLLIVVGGLFALVGAVDFFSAFGGMHPPTLFWCLFVGMPLMFIGFAVTSAGFAGKVARYYSQEYTPVATDTFKYAAREAKDGIRDVTSAIAEGLALPNQVELTEDAQPSMDAATGAGSGSGTGQVRATTRPAEALGPIQCHRCHHENAARARFCSACGVALAKTVPCPHCREPNDSDAKFCDSCGKPMG